MNRLFSNKLNIDSILVTIGVMLCLGTLFHLIDYSLFIPILLFVGGFHLYLFRKASLQLFLNLALLLTILTFTTEFIVSYTTIPRYYIPIASVGMLVMLLYNDFQLAFVMSFLSSAIVTLVLQEDFSYMLIFFVGGLTGTYAVAEARTRGQLINAGLFTGIIQVACAALSNPDMRLILHQDYLLHVVRPLMINGIVAAIVVMSISKVFEGIFGVLTNFSLLELSDFNHPLLRRMILEAPGTYHHSLVVSNLSEAAADSIGANALLTRVGAYYHDIGKMVKPEYFTENQMIHENKHDDIEPTMSRLVILNHVKEGVDMAKKYRLNPAIIDFIPQHHGTSLIYYFYQKALEDAKEDETVSEDNFRYPGPKPQSRETAIVMLADSVEGATRTIEEPNPKKIGEMVRKVINNKFIDGQLDECNLTLKEIDRISTEFTRVLSAMYHGRVKYPEKKTENGNSPRKQAEDNSN